MQREAPACSPLFDGRHDVILLPPAALESRGAGNAQERRRWRRKRLSIRGSGAVAASGNAAGTACRDGGPDAQELNGHHAQESGTEERGETCGNGNLEKGRRVLQLGSYALDVKCEDCSALWMEPCG